MSKIAIFYISLSPGRDRHLVVVDGYEVYIRGEISNAPNLNRALDEAKPGRDENLMNTHFIEKGAVLGV
jgi:hypothetical protein